MSRKSITFGMLALATAAFVTPAASQSIQLGPDGVRINQDDNARSNRNRRVAEISERQAVRIAKAEGVRDVDDVDLMRRAYRIEGTDRSGEDIRVDVDRFSGEVLSVR